MKRYFLIVLLLAPFFAGAQSGTGIFSAIRSKVADSTTVATPAGYGIIYYNAQSNKFRVYANGAWSDLGAGGGGSLSGSGTTNQIAYWTGASALGSLTTATYPSLTELSYVKGVSSAIQTQFSAKENLSNKVTSLTTMDNDKYPTTASMFADRTVTSSDAIVQSDNGKTIYFDSATDFNFTIDALTAKTQVSFINIGAGTVTFVNGSGVTYSGNSTIEGSSNLSAAIIYKTSTEPIILGGGAISAPLIDPMTTRGDVIVRDATNTTDRLPIGTNGQVLMSDGTDISWQTPTAGSVEFSDLIAATGSNTINNAAYAQEWQWNTLGSGTGLLLSSSSTAAASNTNTVFRVNQTGANATSSQTTYGGYFSNTKTGTTGTNIAGYFTASGGATNYALSTVGASTFNGNLTLSNTNSILTLTGGNSLVSSQYYQGAVNSVTAYHISNADVAWSFQRVSGSSTSTSGTLTGLQLDYDFAPTSGTAVKHSLRDVSTINETSTASGDVSVFTNDQTVTSALGNYNGFYHNPTVTTISGNHYAFNSTSGNWKMGGSATNFTLGGGATASELRFLEPSGSGSNYTGFKAVAQSSDITYSLPSALGSGNSTLVDAAGDGVLSWRPANILQSNSAYGTEFVTINFGDVTASTTGSSSIHVNAYYPNKTALIARVTCVGIKTDGTASVLATVTARFRKDNSGTFNLEDAGTVVTSDANVIADLEGEINGTNPSIKWTTGTSGSTYQLIASIETTWVTD